MYNSPDFALRYSSWPFNPVNSGYIQDCSAHGVHTSLGVTLSSLFSATGTESSVSVQKGNHPGRYARSVDLFTRFICCPMTEFHVFDETVGGLPTCGPELWGSITNSIFGAISLVYTQIRSPFPHWVHLGLSRLHFTYTKLLAMSTLSD